MENKFTRKYSQHNEVVFEHESTSVPRPPTSPMPLDSRYFRTPPETFPPRVEDDCESYTFDRPGCRVLRNRKNIPPPDRGQLNMRCYHPSRLSVRNVACKRNKQTIVPTSAVMDRRAIRFHRKPRQRFKIF